jgi:hypothetical protein
MAVTQKEQADRRNKRNGHISCLRPVLEYKEACLSRLIFIFKAFYSLLLSFVVQQAFLEGG